MADPASLIDVGSQLRGLGVATEAYGGVVPPPAAHHQSCGSCTANDPAVGGRPRALRDPRGVEHTRMVAETAWLPCVHDDRAIRDVIGKTTRADGRFN